MLKQRIITALLLMLGILAALFFLPAVFFQYFIIAAFSLAAWEWADLSGFSSSMQRYFYAAVLTMVILLVSTAANLTTLPFLSFLPLISVQDVTGIAGVFWAFALLWVIGYPGSSALWGAKFIRALMGVFVLVPTVISLLYVLALKDGQFLFLYLIGIVASADIGAYFSGRQWGKAKLAVKVSPGKSWAGFWGGVIAVAIYAFCIAQLTMINSLSVSVWVAITMLASVASVLGDLLESMVKRHRGIKDSSQLLPGHGGIMDRVDSMTAAAPVFVLMLILLSVNS